MKIPGASACKALPRLLALPFILSVGFSQRNYNEWSAPSISNFLNVDDSNSVKTIDKLNRYYVMQDLLNSAQQVEDRANRRIHFEFHVGGGAYRDLDQDSTNLLGLISFKLNLMNPKIPDAAEIVTRIHRLRTLTEMSGCPVPIVLQGRLDSIETYMNGYLREFWWKRLSVCASVPFDKNELVGFAYSKTYLCLGYDFGDVLTIQLGMNKDKKLMGEASIDLSTPIISLAEDFKNAISRLLRLPWRGGGYIYDY